MPRASQARSGERGERRLGTSHAQAGTARSRSATELDLGEPRGDLARLGRAGLDADLGRSLAHLAQDGVTDRRPRRQPARTPRRRASATRSSVVLASGERRARQRPSPRARPAARRAARGRRRASRPRRSSTGTLSATSSGSSENQPTSLTTSGLPSDSARIAVPDVSPIVGERRLTWTSHAFISAHSRASST